jgi:hypothetical protein
LSHGSKKGRHGFRATPWSSVEGKESSRLGADTLIGKRSTVRTMPLITLLRIDNFDRVRDIRPATVSDAAIAAVKALDEATEIEPWIQSILHDTNRTPHGPSEIVDILTHKMTVRGREGMGAFILKGRSFPTVRPRHVSHQIFRLERIADLSFAILAASGDVLDDVKEQFVSTATRLGCEYGFLDAHDLARLFVAFGYLCPRDGERIRGGRCSCGYSPQTRTSNILQQEALSELSASHVLRNKAGAVILPTGAGKTRVAAIDVRLRDPALCIYVAHSHEILEDAEIEFLREFPREMVHRFQARPTEAHVKKINLITIQSLSRNLVVFERSRIDYLSLMNFIMQRQGVIAPHLKPCRPVFFSDSLPPRFVVIDKTSSISAIKTSLYATS